MKLSVIIAIDRSGEETVRAVRSVITQCTSFPFEVILVGSAAQELAIASNVKLLPVSDRNPALRRNRAVAASSGEILAFIDDDACAEAGWLAGAAETFDADRSIVAAGGPDTAPREGPVGEAISEMLLATRYIGSGVLCHEAPFGRRDVHSPHDLALVNLFVRRTAFGNAGEFDEDVGYIGEDTTLLARLLAGGRVIYDSALRVRHRRRPFPGPYLRQRWRYRVKTGEMLVGPAGTYRRSGRIWLFLGGCLLFIVLCVMMPRAAAPLAIGYGATALVLGAATRRLPIHLWWLIPFAFAAHHATYFAGIVYGVLRGLGRRVTGQ